MMVEQLAWLALRAHYKDESFQNHQKEAAYASIASSQYQGEHHNFSFLHYFINIRKHTWNWNEMVSQYQSPRKYEIS